MESFSSVNTVQLAGFVPLPARHSHIYAARECQSSHVHECLSSLAAGLKCTHAPMAPWQEPRASFRARPRQPKARDLLLWMPQLTQRDS